jgi:hypothetical protein
MPSLTKVPRNLIYTGGKPQTQKFISNANKDLVDSEILAESKILVDPTDNEYIDNPLDIEFPSGNPKTTRANGALKSATGF